MGAKYKVLSADDELWSRENIRRMLSWEDYSIDFLEPACDGEEVLERIPQEKPDIVITDINMPFISGLELLDKIHTEYPDIITLAVSGYDDFQKVKGVFMAGGIDYLLKPVGREQLVGSLSKALKTLEEREAEKASKEDNRLRENYISSFFEDDEFSSLLNGKLFRPGKESHVPSTRVFSEISTILVKFHDVEILKQNYNKDVLRMSYDIKERLRELIDVEGSIVFQYTDKVNEFIIELNATPARLRLIADRIYAAFPIEKQGPVTIVLHAQASSLDDIATVYREMIAELVSRPFGRRHSIIACNGIRRKSKLQDRFTDRLEAQIATCLENNDISKARSLIMETAGLEKCDSEEWSLFEVTQFTTRMINIIAEADKTSNSRTYEEVQDAINYGLRSLNKDIILDNIELALRIGAGSGAASNAGSSENSTISEQVESVRDYIAEHYMDHLTLSDLAQQFYVEPSYLSKKFSQKYNETITACITRCRMEKAKELMEDENNKLEVISFKVGYDDYNYFSRVFRRCEKKSPTEYRNSISKK
ncbi:Helix-turn-helix domain-containing protein [Butyrivibrio sp. ob235]|uniref:response regulator transcription factor n=1 Tax=Butyrivibrio sp. ob235 TaxID=1761780 RepID=UPI0008B0EA21|nr:response regulator [Butyrivibrio sp. ob235]SEK58597.1 Helix-turn-helix domain-containing protein [Butyrivibrio sp. ob235]